jgi:hypothetical protein
MTPALHRFLAAEDLDSLLAARGELGAPGAQDTENLLAVLRRRDPPQALANLLLQPGVLPQPVRAATVLQALTGEHGTYMQLAAVVGSQELRPGDIGPDTRGRITRALLRAVLRGGGVIAQRASAAIQELAGPEDVAAMAAAALHADPVVRHNARAWLFRHCESTEDLSVRLGPSWPRRARDELLHAFEVVEAVTPVERLLLLCPRLVRIPALREWQDGAGGAS